MATEAAATKVSYTSDNHSAVTTATANWYNSKWGSLPLMYHLKTYTPYNESTFKYYDNLPPAAPTGLSISGHDGDNPQLNWYGNSEGDLKRYKVVRLSPDSDFWYTTSTMYIDYDVEIKSGGTTARYHIIAEDDAGQESIPSSEASIGVIIGKILAGLKPLNFYLYPAHPNPFNPSSTLSYDLSSPAIVSLVVYDMAGNQVSSWSANQVAGRYHHVWHGKYGNGKPAPSGIYLYRLVATPTNGSGPFIETRKMLQLK